MHAVFLLREPRCVLPGRGGSRALGTVGEGPIATCRALAKGIPQPDPEPERPPIPPPDPRLEPRGWSDRPDVWYVRTDGANLDEVVEDARNIVLAVGVPWLERLADVADARQHFAEAPSTNHARGIVAEGYEGALGSPARGRAVDALDELIARLRA